MMITYLRNGSVILLFSLLCLDASSQNSKGDTAQVSVVEQKPRRDQRPWKDRISIGSSTGFWIQPKKTHVEVALLLAYHVPKIFTVGAGYRCIYTRNRVYGQD